MGWAFQVRASSVVRAAPEVVWARISDHEGTPGWVPRGPTWVRVTRPGAHAPGGVGALRTVKFPGWPAVTEEIVAFEPPRRFAYRLRAGMPHVEDHLGVVWVEPADAGATLHWDVDFVFRPWHPLSWVAPAFVAVFGRIVQGGCDELARQLAP